MDHTEEYQCLFHEAHWRALNARPWIWCGLVWNMFDFAADARNEGEQPGINDKGLVTQDRKIKKDAFYFYKANWTTDPFVYVASRRFTIRTASVTTIKVFTTLPQVELFVNGVGYGARQADQGTCVWQGVALVVGDNVVEARHGAVGDSVVWKRV
jgi:beta-galactosidase